MFVSVFVGLSVLSLVASLFFAACSLLFYCRSALCLSFLVGPEGFATTMLLPTRVWLPISDRFRLPSLLSFVCFVYHLLHPSLISPGLCGTGHPDFAFIRPLRDRPPESMSQPIDHLLLWHERGGQIWQPLLVRSSVHPHSSFCYSYLPHSLKT